MINAKGETVCPECGRTYLMDYCLGELRETISSERKSAGKGHCEYCQKPA